MTDPTDDILDWATSRVTGPHVDSYNRPLALADALEDPRRPHHADAGKDRHNRSQSWISGGMRTLGLAQAQDDLQHDT